MVYLGQYRYIDPWGNDIEVQYWSDSLGYHQTDNRPKFDLQPVTETPEVKKAREEHERLWKEAARMNGVEVDTVGIYNTNSDNHYDDADELEGQVSNQHQSLVRYPLLPYSKHLTATNAKEFGHVEDDSVIVDSAAATSNNQVRSRFARQQQDEGEGTGEPRGFFYSFDYPVQYIRSAAATRDLSYEEQQPTNIVEHFIASKASEENQTEDAVLEKKIEVTTELIPVHETNRYHDQQQQPRKVNRSVNNHRGRGSIKFKQTIN